MTSTEQTGVDAAIEKALRRAFFLGEQHWQRADSESYKQNLMADETMEAFRIHVRETIEALARHLADQPAITNSLVQSIIDSVHAGDGMDGDSWDRLLVRATLEHRFPPAQPAAQETDPAPAAAVLVTHGLEPIGVVTHETPPAAAVDAEAIREIVERYVGKTSHIAKYIAEDIAALTQPSGAGRKDSE
jgi:hypothetical protein